MIAVPLPPQSYATVTVTYERGGGIGRFGTWSEAAPLLPGISVGETHWKIVYPENYFFSVEQDSSFKCVEKDRREDAAFFAETFFGRIASGMSPLFTAFASRRSYGRRVLYPSITKQELQGAIETGEASQENRLTSQSENQMQKLQRRKAPLYSLFPEGMQVETEKLGGGGTMRLSYVSGSWHDAVKKSVFWMVVFAGLFLCFSIRRFTFWSVVLSLLFLGTCLPFALQISSPLLFQPFCEGLVVLIAVACLISFVRFVSSGWRSVRRRKKRPAASPVQEKAVLLFAALLMSLNGAVSEGAGEAGKVLSPDDVIISYDPDTMSWSDGNGAKVYMPYEKFLSLWRCAYPEEKRKETDPPVPVVLGDAEYHLDVQKDRCRITGSLTVNVLTDKWITLPLPFERSQLTEIRVDGVEAGVFRKKTGKDARFAGVPFIRLKGKGVKRIELVCMASVEKSPGRFRVTAGVMSGAAATLHAGLPEGAEVEAYRLKSGSKDPGGEALPVVVARRDGITDVLVDLGETGRVALAWSFPGVEGRTGSDVASVSYTSLALVPGACTVRRTEEIRVTGREVKEVVYRVEGDWQIKNVEGTHLSEWNMVRDEESGGQSLEIFFVKPLSRVSLVISGRSIMTGRAPLPSLTLKRAVRQEMFVGLHHSDKRRFRADVLDGMERVSKAVLLRSIPLPSFTMPDRIYHSYGSGAGGMLGAEKVQSELQVNTDLAFILQPGRYVVTARSRYSVKGPGPLHHEVKVPEGMRVRSVQCARMRSWEVVKRGGNDYLVLHFKQRAAAGTNIIWTMEKRISAVPGQVKLPLFKAGVRRGGRIQERMRWLFAANKEFILRAKKAAGWTSISPGGFEMWSSIPASASYRFALRSPRAGIEAGNEIALEIVPRTSRLSAEAVSFVRVAEEYLHVNARVIYRIRMGGCRRFRFLLPPGSELESLETRNQQTREVKESPEGTEVGIVLQTKAMNTHAVDVAYRLKRKQDAEMQISSIGILPAERPVEDVKHYVGVVQTRATLISVLEAERLFRIEAEQFPFLPEGVSASSLKPTYKAVEERWRIVLAEEKIRVVEGPEALIELAELATHIERDGTARTKVTYTLKNRNLQFLVLSLPENAVLWGVTLNGSAVSVGEAKQTSRPLHPKFRIPLEYVGRASMDLELALKYEEPDLSLPALRESASLSAPRVHDVKVMETVWNVFVPEEYRVSLSGGNMHEIPTSTQVAKKVGNLLSQYKKISKAVEESGSVREKLKGRRAMAKLEQILSDNVVQLKRANRSASERAKEDRIGRENLERQWAGNKALIEQAEEEQAELRDTLKREREKDKKKQQGGKPFSAAGGSSSLLIKTISSGSRGGEGKRRSGLL